MRPGERFDAAERMTLFFSPSPSGNARDRRRAPKQTNTTRRYCVVKVLSLPYSGADTVGSYNSKMISGVPSQATDVGSNIPEGVSSLTLHSRGAPVIGRGATLEINARGQPMRIE